MQDRYKTTFESVKSMEPNSIRFHSTFAILKHLFEEYDLRKSDTVDDMIILLESLSNQYDGKVEDSFELRK